MTITVPVAIPDPSLPLADPADRATFTPRKLEHLRWERENLAPGVKALGDASFNNATDAQASATAALASKNAAALSEANAASTANFKGIWSSLTGALNKPASVSHNGTIWALLNNLANVALSQPGVTADWVYVSGSGAPYTPTTALVTQAVMGGRYALTNATTQAAATNLALYSKDFSNAAYMNLATTVSSNATIGPDGQSYAYKLTAAATTAWHDIAQIITTPATTITTATVACKAAGRTTLFLLLYDGVSSGITATFNLTTGAHSVSAYGAGANADSKMTYLGDGWWDCSITGRANSVSGSTVTVVIRPHLDADYLGDGVSGVYVDDLQVETGSVTTSRILTTSATVTRTAGVVAPQRIILPASPATNTQVDVVSANTADTNIIDPNGQQFYGTGGPLAGAMRLDSQNANVKLQFINGFWRSV